MIPGCRASTRSRPRLLRTVTTSRFHGTRHYPDVRWGTYRQIQARGGQVRKGERGTRILSFQDHRRIAVTDERGRPVRDTPRASASTAMSASPRPSSLVRILRHYLTPLVGAGPQLREARPEYRHNMGEEDLRETVRVRGTASKRIVCVPPQHHPARIELVAAGRPAPTRRPGPACGSRRRAS